MNERSPIRATTAAPTAFAALFSAALTTLFAVVVFSRPVPADEAVLVAHLPSTSIEGASRLAEAVGALAEHLAALAPGLVAESEVFRRLDDAQAYLETEPARVVLVLADPGFLLDRPAALDLIPIQRMRVAGRGTYRRLVVSKGAGPQALSDLRGRSLAVAESAGRSLEEYLRHAVFAGEVVPARWFGALERTADDFAAVAAVLYDQTAAALIAEYNPLLESQRRQLQVVYESPPQSLPVLAYNPLLIDAAARARLDYALARLSGTSPGRRARGLLAIDGFEPLGEELANALLRPPATAPKTLVIALPGAIPIPAPVLGPPPSPADLRWPLSLSLPPASGMTMTEVP